MGTKYWKILYWKDSCLTVRLKKSVSQLAGIFNNRFEKLLLSADEATIDAGRKTETQRLIEDSEQHEARRLLLSVEELANKKREKQATAENAFLHQVEADFHQELIADLEIEFRDTQEIMHNVLKIDSSLGRLLDILYTEACSISRLVQCFETLPWLEKATMKFVQQPKYRRVDSAGHPIILKTIRSVLSFIGIESLRTLIPVLIAKHTNPMKSEFTPDLVKHMWLYTIGTGNIAKALAESRGTRPHFGFNLGLMSNIGRTAIVNLYLRAFDRTLRQQIIKARKDNNPNKAKALGALSPSHKYIIMLWKRHASRITANIVNELNCKWLTIATGFEDYAQIREISMASLEKQDLHPFARLLFSAQGFMQYKMMHNERLMGKTEAMMYLRNFGIASKDVATVSKINLVGVELNIAGIIDESPAKT